jgi:hypothetical protein
MTNHLINLGHFQVMVLISFSFTIYCFPQFRGYKRVGDCDAYNGWIFFFPFLKKMWDEIKLMYVT